MKIIECPRDAMQGLDHFVPTEKKIEYINQLLKVGFDTIDFGSFVSPKAIPQMKDTHEVVRNLDESDSKLLAIVANQRGVDDALQYDNINCIGFPLSISETFQKRNTNTSISESLLMLSTMNELVVSEDKEMVVYLSMGFGNPYGDDYDIDILQNYLEEVIEIGIKTISIADTVGNATKNDISKVFSELKYDVSVEVGAHLHTNPDSAIEISEALITNRIQRIDTAIKGFGGCPFAENELTGNLPTEIFVNQLSESIIDTGLNLLELERSIQLSEEVFIS